MSLIEKNDRRVKWWLLLTSLITLAVLFSAALRENVLSEWRSIQNKYIKILNDKAIDEHGKKIRDQFEMSIHQNFLPELNIVDRCITCHTGMDDPRMADEKIPFRTHPGDYIKNHPSQKFGCTLCHKGQGRALEYQDSKGLDVNWDYPMLPKKYLQAECGYCHSNITYTPKDVLTKGRDLFNSIGCPECHNKQDLANVGLRLLDRKWWIGHKNYYFEPGSNQKSFTDLTEKEKETLQDFLLSKNGAPIFAFGKWLYTEFGCGSCHKIQGSGGVMGPDLSNEGNKIPGKFSFANVEGKKTVPNWIFNHFLDPQKIVPDSQMPQIDMTKEEAEALTCYILSLKTDPALPSNYIPTGIQKAVIQKPKGRELYLTYCQACHGKEGEGSAYTTFNKAVPGIFNPDFLRIAPNAFIRNIVKTGRPDQNMPFWKNALDPVSLEKIFSYIEEKRPKPKPFAQIAKISPDPKRGEEIYKKKCAYCHESVGPSLNSPIFLQIANNEFIYETIVRGRPFTSMPSWADLSVKDLANLLSLFDMWRTNAPLDEKISLENFIPGNSKEGKQVYAVNCSRCHGEIGEGKIAAALHNPVLLDSASPQYLALSLHRCRKWAIDQNNNPKGPPELNKKDLANVISYLYSWKNAPMPVEPPFYKPQFDGDPLKGKNLYNESCADCHGEKGNSGFAVSIGNPKYLKMLSDGYLFASATIGREDTIMEAFGLNKKLSPKDIKDIIAYLRAQQRQSEKKSSK